MLSFNKKYEKVSLFHKQFIEAKPFPHVVLTHFFDKQFIVQLRDAVLTLEFKELDTDLYHFLQSEDIENTRHPVLQEFYTSFSSPSFLPYISSLTGIAVTSIDMSACIYQSTDHLLCHDDTLEGRKIAYILYLTTLKPKDGGQLQFFAVNDGKPTQVIKSFIPQENTLLLFTVCPESFHHVSEVLTDTQRITLVGWFHG